MIRGLGVETTSTYSQTDKGCTLSNKNSTTTFDCSLQPRRLQLNAHTLLKLCMPELVTTCLPTHMHSCQILKLTRLAAFSNVRFLFDYTTYQGCMLVKSHTSITFHKYLDAHRTCFPPYNTEA